VKIQVKPFSTVLNLYYTRLLQHRIDYQVSVFKYNTSVPQYLSQRVKRHVNARTLRSSATTLLIQLFTRTDFAKRSFWCAMPSGTHFPRLSLEATHCPYSNLG